MERQRIISTALPRPEGKGEEVRWWVRQGFHLRCKKSLESGRLHATTEKIPGTRTVGSDGTDTSLTERRERATATAVRPRIYNRRSEREGPRCLEGVNVRETKELEGFYLFITNVYLLPSSPYLRGSSSGVSATGSDVRSPFSTVVSVSGIRPDTSGGRVSVPSETLETGPSISKRH